jgi:hypothetical protein
MEDLSVTGRGTDPFADMEIPPELEASLQRHREHLSRLVHTMRQAGISQEQIEDSVSVIIASYKDELIHAMKSLVEGNSGRPKTAG